MRKLIPDCKIWETFTGQLSSLTKKYPFVRLDYYGFIADWKEILGIKKSVQE